MPISQNCIPAGTFCSKSANIMYTVHSSFSHPHSIAHHGPAAAGVTTLQLRRLFPLGQFCSSANKTLFRTLHLVMLVVLSLKLTFLSVEHRCDSNVNLDFQGDCSFSEGNTHESLLPSVRFGVLELTQYTTRNDQKDILFWAFYYQHESLILEMKTIYGYFL